MALFDRHLWHCFRAIAVPFWRLDEKWKARWLLVLLVMLLLGQTGFAVLLNEQTGEFTSALAAKDADRFWYAIKKCLVLLTVAVPVYAFYYFVRENLGLQWRRWMTLNFLSGYLSHRAYYELNSHVDIDNPDQRIAEDINTFTHRTLYFLLILIGSLLQLLAFFGILWSISRELVVFLIFYAAAGTAITLLVFGKALIGINFFQLKREADFRFSLVRIRENAEPIAFYRGEMQESSEIHRRFKDVFSNFSKLIRVQLSLNLFQYGYSFMTIILPSAIIAGRVISGELEVGRAVQAAGAFAAILSALTVIIDNFESFSKFIAGIERLDSFARFIEAKRNGSSKEESRITFVQASRLQIEHLTLQTPNHGVTLINDLSLTINSGESIMIVGASGCGKSSLLRAIAGLWLAGSGRIVRPDSREMMFLPQRPYMLLTSLRSQLLYPQQDREISDIELLRLLDSVNLSDLAARFGGLDTALDWAKVLSVGEQQRVAIARVLLAAPRYAVLDEATSALDIGNEETLYRRLAACTTTLISVGHRPALLKYHHYVLELSGHGRWQLYPATEYRFN